MPHKRNPITCERIAGLSRVLRGNALAAMEDVALWHERDITHSSVERVIVPDRCILLDYMLSLITDVIDRLIVYPENMVNLGYMGRCDEKTQLAVVTVSYCKIGICGESPLRHS